MENFTNSGSAKYDYITSESLEKLESNKINLNIEYERIPMEDPHNLEGQLARLGFINQYLKAPTDYISGKKKFDNHEILKGNIENYIGMSQIPTGIVGPLVINGTHAQGAFYVPLATTEGALLASYGRGAKACRESGFITVACLQEGVQRCPFFKFDSIIEAGKFANWALENQQIFRSITEKASNYAQLKNIEIDIAGNEVIIKFEYTTGDASGQNMVTICTHHICHFIIEHCPVKPNFWAIDGNASGDKKATALSLAKVRGKKVTAEVVLKREAIMSVLKSTPENMAMCAAISANGSIKIGTLGTGMHPANGLTALFIACGQDAACVSEASAVITNMSLNDNGDLYCSITMPNVIVGSVGGGTALPTQKECLSLIDCYGPGKSTKLAEICAALCLAGEISILSAMSVGHFASAHQKLGRKDRSEK